MKSIKLKLVVLYLILVFIVMIVSSTFMLMQVKNRETEKARDELSEFANKIYTIIILGYSSSDQFQTAYKDFYLFSSNMSRIQGFILDSKWQTLMPEEYLTEKFRNSVIISAYDGKKSFGSGESPDYNGQLKKWLYYAEPVYVDSADGSKSEIKYVIFTRMDANPIDENLSDTTRIISFMVALALVLTSVLGFIFSSTLTEPIIKLTKKVKEAAKGNLNEPIKVISRDEIGQLTETFNEMSQELNTIMANITSEKNKIEVVLHNMSDGVLAYDANGAIVHANSASYELLGIKELDRYGFAEMSDKLGLGQLNIRSLLTESIVESSMTIGDKFISVCLTPYLNKYRMIEGIVIVLQDVTRHKKLDNMRKEFVANVSHELRTPLTTIKTYTETLIDGAWESKDILLDFLKVIDSETERMTNLVKDLLELSRFDNRQLKLELDIFDIRDMIRQSIKQNEILAEKKRQRVSYTPSAKPLSIEADSARINQVLTNIISNSIKYTPEGGEIEISTEDTEKYVRVIIKDNGIGIPEDDLSRIFERFYRVDKARSREMGGTGLGLAIAKEIMEAHGGRIYAVSENGKGTTMILRFNKFSFQEQEANADGME